MTILLSLLSSAGFGSILGLIGGILNRLLDLKSKQLEREYDLRKLDKERELLKEEYEGRRQIATIEGEASIESAAYGAMQESYSFAAPSSKDGWVDSLSKIIRPFLTISFFLVSVYIFYQIHQMMGKIDTELNVEAVIRMWNSIIEWVLFQAGVTIGWWFANRPSKMPKLQ